MTIKANEFDEDPRTKLPALSLRIRSLTSPATIDSPSSSTMASTTAGSSAPIDLSTGIPPSNTTVSDPEQTLFQQLETSNRYDVISLNVLSSSSISARVAAALAVLVPDDPALVASAGTEASSRTPNVQPIVRLSAVAKVANKLISIVEIIKRESKSKGLQQVFQYNALTSKVVEVPRQRPVKKKNTLKSQDGEADEGMAEDGDADEDEEDAFQTMKRHNMEEEETGMKKRTVPVLTIYLAATSVRELKVAFG